eukprot:759897-Hanusia_phi.AAC.3
MESMRTSQGGDLSPLGQVLKTNDTAHVPATSSQNVTVQLLLVGCFRPHGLPRPALPELVSDVSPRHAAGHLTEVAALQNDFLHGGTAGSKHLMQLRHLDPQGCHGEGVCDQLPRPWMVDIKACQRSALCVRKRRHPEDV